MNRHPDGLAPGPGAGAGVQGAGHVQSAPTTGTLAANPTAPTPSESQDRPAAVAPSEERLL
jgi:hypothetical protein